MIVRSFNQLIEQLHLAIAQNRAATLDIPPEVATLIIDGIRNITELTIPAIRAIDSDKQQRARPFGSALGPIHGITVSLTDKPDEPFSIERVDDRDLPSDEPSPNYASADIRDGLSSVTEWIACEDPACPDLEHPEDLHSHPLHLTKPRTTMRQETKDERLCLTCARPAWMHGTRHDTCAHFESSPPLASDAVQASEVVASASGDGDDACTVRFYRDGDDLASIWCPVCGGDRHGTDDEKELVAACLNCHGKGRVGIEPTPLCYSATDGKPGTRCVLVEGHSGPHSSLVIHDDPVPGVKAAAKQLVDRIKAMSADEVSADLRAAVRSAMVGSHVRVCGFRGKVAEVRLGSPGDAGSVHVKLDNGREVYAAFSELQCGCEVPVAMIDGTCQTCKRGIPPGVAHSHDGRV